MILRGELTGPVAAVLLMAGGLEAVKQVAIIAAFPFLFVMIGPCVSLVKALRAEPTDIPEPGREQERDADAADEPRQGPGVMPAEALADTRPTS